MDCYRPLRIRNQYNGKYLHVNCRNCPACLVKSANVRASQLSASMRHYKYCYFLTLTYKNEFVPYVLLGLPYVYRSYDFEIIGEIEEPLFKGVTYKYLVNHEVSGAIGVLWSYDVQCFLKRFRKYINKNYGKREFKYFVLFEYGSKYGRPHQHIAIMSDSLLYEECEVAAIQSWKYHDWNRFYKDGTNQACKRCNGNLSSYLASYVNSFCTKLAISQYKQFRQKTCRSKNMHFGLDDEIFERYKEDVIRMSNGLVSEGERKVFYYLQADKKDSITYRPIQKRYLDTCFHKFKSFGELSVNDKFSRAEYIVERIDKAKELGIPLNNIAGLKSDDFSFYRSYIRFNNIFRDWFSQNKNSEDGFKRFRLADYLSLMLKVFDRYESIKLYEQMKEFSLMGSEQYFLNLLDTKVEKPEKRLLYVSLKLKKTLNRNIDMNCVPIIRNKLDGYVHRYKTKLMVKHLNDESGFLNQL